MLPSKVFHAQCEKFGKSLWVQESEVQGCVPARFVVDAPVEAVGEDDALGEAGTLPKGYGHIFVTEVDPEGVGQDVRYFVLLRKDHVLVWGFRDTLSVSAIEAESIEKRLDEVFLNRLEFVPENVGPGVPERVFLNRLEFVPENVGVGPNQFLGSLDFIQESLSS